MAKENTQIQKNPVAIIKSYLANDSVKIRFKEMLGKRSDAYINSIINVVRNDANLQKCIPESVVAAAIRAATFNLMIDPSLGQAAIVPYKEVANFQIMYKGIVQLCIRSGQYATIHCTEIYRDELKSWNPVTGKVEFHDQKEWKLRENGDPKDVIGHYAHFKLLAGFEKCDYMTHEQAMAHAKRFSKAYQYDIKFKKKTSCWSTFPVAMGNKTVLIRLLTKYGIMSVEMQEAYYSERESFEEAEEAAAKRIDAEAGSDVIDTDFEPQPPSPELKTDPMPDEPPKEETAPPAEKDEQEKSAEKTTKKTTSKKNQPEYLYACQCGHKFDEPKVSGTGATQVAICPKCFSKNIKATSDAA